MEESTKESILRDCLGHAFPKPSETNALQFIKIPVIQYSCEYA